MRKGFGPNSGARSEGVDGVGGRGVDGVGVEGDEAAATQLGGALRRCELRQRLRRDQEVVTQLGQQWTPGVPGLSSWGDAEQKSLSAAGLHSDSDKLALRANPAIPFR